MSIISKIKILLKKIKILLMMDIAKFETFKTFTILNKALLFLTKLNNETTLAIF